jgi:methyl-accepting chemotaxis protein
VSEREHKLVIATQEAIALIQQISSELRQRSNDNEALTLQQQERIDSLASATEQMASSVREVASHAHDTSSQTSEAAQLTTQGQTQVITTLSAINQLGTEINSASKAVQELDSNAAQIDDVVTTISAISEQTNLLALNAAIEAARAGEQGRGFAVVADEVRTLAQRTQDSTIEIEDIINKLQGETNIANNKVSATQKRAADSIKGTHQIELALDSIVTSVSSVTLMIEQIASTAGEQVKVTEEINHKISDIDVKSESVTSGAREVSNVANEQANIADNLNKLAAKFIA